MKSSSAFIKASSSSDRSSSDSFSFANSDNSSDSIESFLPQPFAREKEPASPKNESYSHYKRIRYGIQHIKYVLEGYKDAEKSSTPKIVELPSATKKMSLLQLAINYEYLAQRLGIEEAPTHNYDSLTKMRDFVALLTLLAKILEQGHREHYYFIQDVMAELRKVYFWMTATVRFTKQDKACLKDLATIVPDRDEKYKHRIYQLLNIAVNKAYTPPMLLLLIHGMRAFNTLKVDKPDADAAKKTRQHLQEKHAKRAKKGKYKNKPYNSYLYLVEVMDKADVSKSKIDVLHNSMQRSQNGFFVSDNTTLKHQFDSTVIALYWYSEEVIKTSVDILSNPNCRINDKNKRKQFNNIILYYSELQQLAFSLSPVLAKLLEKEKCLMQAVSEIQSVGEFDRVSYVYVHHNPNLKIEAYDKNNEAELVTRNISRLGKNNEVKSCGTRGNEQVFIVKLERDVNNAKLEQAENDTMIIRGKPTSVKDEAANCDANQLRYLVSNSLIPSGITKLYATVAGDLDPMTRNADESYRHYEFSEAVLLDNNNINSGQDLMTYFQELHAAYREAKSEIKLINLQANFIDIALQIVNAIAYLEKHKRYLTDTKPTNFLLLPSPLKKLCQFQNILAANDFFVTVSDVKGLLRPDEDDNFLTGRFVYRTGGFFTQACYVYVEDKKESIKKTHVDLNIIMHQTVVLTLFQLLTLTELNYRETDGHQVQYQELCSVLKNRQDLYKGPIGMHVKEISQWMLDFFNLNTTFDYLFDYFKHPRVVVSMTKAVDELRNHLLDDNNTSPNEPMNMSPDVRLKDEKS